MGGGRLIHPAGVKPAHVPEIGSRPEVAERNSKCVGWGARRGRGSDWCRRRAG
jgi:hypothetical protein